MKDKRVLYFIIIIESIILICLGGYRIYQYNNIKDLSNNDDVINDENNNDSIVEEDKDSINEDNLNDIKYYTVSFDSNGGNEIEDIKVKEGTKVKLPTAYLIGYTFNGWLLDNQIIDGNYEITKDMNLKAKWLENEDNNKEIVEYIFDKIEEFNGDINSIKLLHDFEKGIKANYKDENISIEVLLDNEKTSYIKINDKLSDININSYINAVRVFKFNSFYIIEYSVSGSQCFNEYAVILDKKGDIIEKIGFEKLISDIEYSKEKNQIVVTTMPGCGISLFTALKTLTHIYSVNNNEFKLIDTNYHKDKIFVYSNSSLPIVISQVKSAKVDVLYTYNCISNNCKVFDANERDMLIYDDGYYIYNYKDNTKKLIESKDKNGSLSFLDGKVIFYNENDKMYYIYDEYGNYVVKVSSKPYKLTIDNKIYYFTDTFISNEKGSTVDIYDKNFKKLWVVSGLSKNNNYEINSNNTITFNAKIDGVYVVFDSDMKLIYESSKYEMLGIVDGYVIVVVDSKLKVLDINENAVSEFDYLPNAYSFSSAYIDKSHNLVIRIYDYENAKLVDYYYNINTKESNIVRR